MKFFSMAYKTPLYLAIEEENADIVKLLLASGKLDINRAYV